MVNEITSSWGFVEGTDLFVLSLLSSDVEVLRGPTLCLIWAAVFSSFSQVLIPLNLSAVKEEPNRRLSLALKRRKCANVSIVHASFGRSVSNYTKKSKFCGALNLNLWGNSRDGSLCTDEEQEKQRRKRMFFETNVYFMLLPHMPA